MRRLRHLELWSRPVSVTRTPTTSPPPEGYQASRRSPTHIWVRRAQKSPSSGHLSRLRSFASSQLREESGLVSGVSIGLSQCHLAAHGRSGPAPASGSPSNSAFNNESQVLPGSRRVQAASMQLPRSCWPRHACRRPHPDGVVHQLRQRPSVFPVAGPWHLRGELSSPFGRIALQSRGLERLKQ